MNEYYFVARFSIVAKDEEKAYELAYAHDFDLDNLEIVDECVFDDSDAINDERKIKETE